MTPAICGECGHGVAEHEPTPGSAGVLYRRCTRRVPFGRTPGYFHCECVMYDPQYRIEGVA